MDLGARHFSSELCYSPRSWSSSRGPTQNFRPLVRFLPTFPRRVHGRPNSTALRSVLLQVANILSSQRRRLSRWGPGADSQCSGSFPRSAAAALLGSLSAMETVKPYPVPRAGPLEWAQDSELGGRDLLPSPAVHWDHNRADGANSWIELKSTWVCQGHWSLKSIPVVVPVCLRREHQHLRCMLSLSPGLSVRLMNSSLPSSDMQVIWEACSLSSPRPGRSTEHPGIEHFEDHCALCNQQPCSREEDTSV